MSVACNVPVRLFPDEEEMTIDKIFTELGVYEDRSFLMPLSPAHSPIYSPAPPPAEVSKINLYRYRK